MKNFFAIIAVTVLSIVCVNAQTLPKPSNPKYDEKLAKKVGADNIGMRRYVIAILKTGPKDSEISGDERTRLFTGHFDNMKRLSNDGKLAVAGPFGQNDKAFRGLFLLAVPTIDEAIALTETDPCVKAGIFVVEYLPWFGAASLMLTNENYEKTAKTRL